MIITGMYDQILHFNHPYPKWKSIIPNTNKINNTRLFLILSALKGVGLNAFVAPVIGTALSL